MKLLLSLDYELFFGSRIGSVRNCLIDPITFLLKETAGTGLRLSLFVDAAFLVRLRQESAKHPSLQAEYDLIRRHLEQLSRSGHDIQLHIHPHWIDSYFDGSGWKIDTARYTLHDFSSTEQRDIVHSCKKELVDIVGDAVFAFRGGGWCIQPFAQIADALRAENIWLESTVFFQGTSEDSQRGYDFSRAPDLDYYRFGNDPVFVDNKGDFVEVQIGSFRVHPAFFWRLAWAKKMGGSKHQSYGDGCAMIADKGYYIRRLTRSSNSVISIDGLKAGLLAQAYKQTRENTKRNLLHVMGHPKAIAPYSIDKLSEFLKLHSFNFITYQDFFQLKPEYSVAE